METPEEAIAIEMRFPGKLIGRVVRDARGECVGVVRSIEIDLSSKETNLILYGEEGSKTIPLHAVRDVTEEVVLNRVCKRGTVKEGNERKIKRRVKKEIESILTVSSLLLDKEK